MRCLDSPCVTMQISRSVCIQSVCSARSHLTQLTTSPSSFSLHSPEAVWKDCGYNWPVSYARALQCCPNSYAEAES